MAKQPGSVPRSALSSCKKEERIRTIEEELTSLEPRLAELEGKLEQTLASWQQAFRTLFTEDPVRILPMPEQPDWLPAESAAAAA